MKLLLGCWVPDDTCPNGWRLERACLPEPSEAEMDAMRRLFDAHIAEHDETAPPLP